VLPGVSHASIPSNWGPASPNLCDQFLCAENQILQGDQTRCEENF